MKIQDEPSIVDDCWKKSISEKIHLGKNSYLNVSIRKFANKAIVILISSRQSVAVNWMVSVLSANKSIVTGVSDHCTEYIHIGRNPYRKKSILEKFISECINSELCQ